jgi:hypothetical protein
MVDVWDWMIRWTMGMLAPGLRRKSREEEIEVECMVMDDLGEGKRGMKGETWDVHLVDGDIADFVRIACKVGQEQDVSSGEGRFHRFAIASEVLFQKVAVGRVTKVSAERYCDAEIMLMLGY